MDGEATALIKAKPEEIYDLVADVTKMGLWSPECYRCEWIDGAVGPVAGARFKAWNRRGLLRWSNKPVVTAAARGQEFAFSRSGLGQGVIVWRYRIQPAGAGSTQVTESWEVLRPPWRMVRKMVELLERSGDPLGRVQRGMETTLARLKTAAEHGGATP
ncbi:MAG: SRPBCC family protein [Acidimicrobiales bacterium]